MLPITISPRAMIRKVRARRASGPHGEQVRDSSFMLWLNASDQDCEVTLPLNDWVQQGVVVLDEAYVDFAEETALSLALKYRHVLVARTFSKAYSLCFQRVGYFVGSRELIAAHKAELVLIECDDPGVLHDIDRREDLAK